MSECLRPDIGIRQFLLQPISFLLVYLALMLGLL